MIDRITNSLQSSLMEENILLGDNLSDQMDGNLTLMSPARSDISNRPRFTHSETLEKPYGK
ncbi:hypothetical protein NQ314_011340 [Rhamnusium bicolor]|uniref:Uncharacterized protein n=1 Tax=Rhamnusium bicolor TaxID=1586634 RepID=A0AAV8XJ18_9CUCU|nr:hypothetical protein NQ314_011340 [Rhamnusium bicolor]